jgi:prepilin-type N-terminal cleavage/methylation domain-containing protein/prepilin-type processing-associated H-X9-DG protein
MPVRARPSRAAFTMIELLVVVSIIAILASLLIPAITMARSLAMATQCMAHLRQIPIAVEAYAQETHGRLVLSKIGVGGLQKQWETLLAEQVPDVLGGTNNVLTTGTATSQARKSIVRGCPSFMPSLNTGASTALLWTTGYGLSEQPLLPYTFNAYNWYYGNAWWGSTQFMLDRVPDQSSRILCGDSDDFWLNAQGAGGSGWSAAQPRMWEASGNRTSGFIRPGHEAWRRHRGLANYACYDGHVQRLGSAQAIDRYMDPTNSLGLNAR